MKKLRGEQGVDRFQGDLHIESGGARFSLIFL